MRRGDTLILFVKEPRLGRVKSRLARGIGASAALAVYRELTRAACRRIGFDRRWRMVLMTTPDRARSRDWPRSLEREGQGCGHLGRRMAQALRRLARPRAILVGSDVPGLSPDLIRRGFQALGRAPFVFGPALDGGYWLIGWRRGAWPMGALERVRWSSPHALEDSLASIGRRRSTLIDRLRDLDDVDDYKAWRRNRRGYSAALRPDSRKGASTSRWKASQPMQRLR